MTENKQIKNAISEEIDIIGIISKVIKGWKKILPFLLISAVIGVIVALSTPKSYTASVVLAPEMSSGGLGMSESLGDLASSFGIDLGNKSSMDAIYPELYPEIFASTDFIMEIFPITVRQKDNTCKTYLEHITRDLKIPFWEYPRVWITKILKEKEKEGNSKNIDLYRISKDEEELCKFVRSSVTCNVDKKTSVITVSVTDQDPMVAAILADTLQLRLQKYITEYRTQKARNDYEYYKKLYSESKSQYIKIQHLYASYVDANQDVVLQAYKSKVEEIENELQLCYNVYNQISAQLQNAKAKIQEKTPAFTVIEKAKMPYKASSTPRSIIVILFCFLGFIIGSLWVIVINDKMKKIVI